MKEKETSVLAEQQKQQFIVEKFKEILGEIPRHYLWKDRINGTLKKIQQDEIVALYEGKEGEFLRAITLKADRKDMQLLVPISAVLYTDCIGASVKKTTGEQLREMAEENGKPSRILYIRTDWDNIEEKSDSFFGVFPFGEISEDLGLR